MLCARWSYALVPWQARRFLHLLRSLRRSILRRRKRHTDAGKLSGWRAWALALVLFVGLGSLSGTAYAIDTEIIVGPNVVTYPNSNTTGQGYIVAADNVYAAAEPVLGIDYDGLTDDEKALLSNESTGGAFYTFVNKFQTMANGNYPSGGWVTSEFCGNLVAVYGNDYLYWIDFTTAEKTAAQISFALVKAGQVGGGVAGDDYLFDGTAHYYNSTNAVYGIYNLLADSGTTYTFSIKRTGVLVMPSTFTVSVPANLVNTALGNLDPDDYDLYLLVNNITDNADNSSVRFGGNIYVIPKGYSSPVYNSYTVGSYTNSVCDRLTISQTVSGYVVKVSGCTYSFDGSTLTLVGGSSNRTGQSFNAGTFSNRSAYAGLNGCIMPLSTGGGTPVIPPTNWPTTPTNPTVDPPQVPNPDPPVTTPIYPTTNIYQDVTYVTADIAAILDALNEHCEHLQRSISDNFYDFWTVWSTQISDEFSHLEDYLHDLFVWLAAQFDFDSGAGYNDDTVVSWLKKIWLKLGTGGNSRPTDPVVDPFAWAEWLQQLLANFLTALLGLGTGAVDDVVDDLTALLGKFPFCVPWDLAAALAILDAEPIVPEFEWPMFYLDATGLHTFSVELSMEPYDEYMGGVRFMFKLIWIVVLLWKTKDAMELLKLGGATGA